MAVFVASRVLYASLGVRFDGSPLYGFWQYIDPTVLRSDPIGAIWWSHTQPPLFNSLLAFVLNVTAGDGEQLFRLLFMLMGLMLTCGVYRLGLHLDASPVVAFTIAVVVGCNPTTLLMENWLFYPLPVATLLVMVSLGFARFRLQPRVAHFAVVAILATVTTLTRATYHPVWLVATLALAWLLGRGGSHRRALAVSCALLVLPLGWMLKNQVQYGEFTLSSWSGMNGARIAVEGIDENDRADLVEQGVLSPLALVKPFQSFGTYSDAGYSCTPSVDNPVTARPEKANGDPNFNYECYLPVYDQYGADAVDAVLARPSAYVRQAASAFHFYLRPAHSDGHVAQNRGRMGMVNDLYSNVVLGQGLVRPLYSDTNLWPEETLAMPSNEPMSPTVLLALATTLGWGAVAGWQIMRKRADPNAALVAFIGWIVLWPTIVYSVAEIGENYRFRYEIEPLTFLMLGVALERAIRRFRNRGQGAGDESAIARTELTRDSLRGSDSDPAPEGPAVTLL